MWSEESWGRCLAAASDLVKEAEAAEMDVAAHPHIMSPLCSVERHKELFEAVPSPRLKALMDCVKSDLAPHVLQNNGTGESDFR